MRTQLHKPGSSQISGGNGLPREPGFGNVGQTALRTLHEVVEVTVLQALPVCVMVCEVEVQVEVHQHKAPYL
jgi:hypothetical protein